jgi:hypothetical protein
VDELYITGLRRYLSQAFGGIAHKSLHLIQTHILLVPITRAAFVKAELDSEVELLRLERTGRKEDPL